MVMVMPRWWRWEVDPLAVAVIVTGQFGLPPSLAMGASAGHALTSQESDGHSSHYCCQFRDMTHFQRTFLSTGTATPLGRSGNTTVPERQPRRKYLD
jgi:hypothetical protein